MTNSFARAARFALPISVLALSASIAGAGTVSFTTQANSFDFDPQTLSFNDDAWADDAAVFSTTPAGTPAASPGAGADGDLATATNLNDSLVELFFTDNVLINGAGNDLVIFQNTNNNVIRLTTAAGVPATASPTRFIRATEPGNTSGFEIGVVEFDLSDLGIADGAEVTSGLFLGRGGVFSTVWDVAALNSQSVVSPPPNSPNAVPLPAAGWALLAALGALVGLRRAR